MNQNFRKRNVFMKDVYGKALLKNHPAGFTLVELLVSITVMTLFMVLAIPSFMTFIQNNRVMAQMDEFANSLNYARTTALNQNITVAACPATAANSTTCGTNWNTGWIVITQPASGAPVLLATHMTGTNDPTLSSVTVSSPAATIVSFDSTGLATSQANFKSCDSRGGSYARSLEVLPTGFIQTGSGMGIAAWNGATLTCP